MGLTLLAGDGPYGAPFRTQRTSRAECGIDLESEQRFALTCRTPFMQNVRFILVHEITHRGQYRTRCGLAQTAKRSLLYRQRQLLEQRGISFTEKLVVTEDDAVAMERAVASEQ